MQASIIMTIWLSPKTYKIHTSVSCNVVYGESI